MLNTQKHAVRHLAVYIVLRQKNTVHFGRIIAPANSKTLNIHC